jgi:hypothetical protein
LHNVNRQQLQQSDLWWLHLDRLDHLNVVLGIQEAARKDRSITYRKGITPYDHSTELDTHLKLGVRVRSIGAANRRSNAGLRRGGRERYATTGARLSAQHLPWRLKPLTRSFPATRREAAHFDHRATNSRGACEDGAATNTDLRK